MNLVPHAISRKVAEQGLLARKNAPTILFGAGVVSMVGSTVLACRATLKLEEVLETVQKDKQLAHSVKEAVDDGEVKTSATYTDEDVKRDTAIIYTRGAVQVIKLYAPAVILGGVGIACLTKSHSILKERNAALAAAYFAIDQAFQTYRERVRDRYGDDVDRELRYGSEEVTVIDEDTGKSVDVTRVEPGEPSGYARWFDGTNANWNAPPFENYNWTFLRSQQNWANDMLRSRGHLFLNEAYGLCGLSHTSAGAIVGWVYDRANDDGDNYVDFGCWEQQHGVPLDFFKNGQEGSILLDFNVDGPIWQLIDERNAKDTSR
jgi:hypothetical protein